LDSFEFAQSKSGWLSILWQRRVASITGHETVKVLEIGYESHWPLSLGAFHSKYIYFQRITRL
jgi:hypothetical protein